MLDTDRRVLVLAFARMADALANSFLIVVLPLYIASGGVAIEGLVHTRVPVLGVELTEALLIGIVLSLFGFLNSFSQPFTGRLSDRTGRRKVYILFGLALLAAASAAYAVVTSYWAVVAVRALQGIGAAFTIPCTVALVNELGETRTRGGNFGVYNTFRLIGFGFGPLIAGVVVEAGPYSFADGAARLSGFDAAFAVAVLGALVSFGMVTVLVSDPEETRAAAGEDLSIAVRDPAGGLDPVFALGVATVVMGLGIALFAALENGINARLDQGSTFFGLQFGAVVIANVALQVPVGRASDRWGRRPFLLAGFVLLVPATLAQGLATTSWGMVVARLVQGVGVACVFAPSLAVAGDLAREGESGTTLSVLTMGFGLGTAFGPLVSGYMVRFGFVVPFAFAAGLAVLALVLVFTQVEETVDVAEPGPEAVPQD